MHLLMAQKIFLLHAVLVGALEVRAPQPCDWPRNKIAFLAFWEATLGSNNCGDIGHEFFNLDLNCSSFVNRLCAYVCLPSGTPTFRADAPFLSQQEHLQRTHFVTPPFSLL